MRNLILVAFTLFPATVFAGTPLGVPLPVAGAFGPAGLAIAAAGYIGWRLLKKRRGN